MRRIAPWLGILATLALAYGFDRLLEGARNTVQARVDVATYQWLLVGTNLVFAACILGLAWSMFSQGGRRRWVAAVCLVAGLALVLVPAPPFWSLGATIPERAFPVLQASPFSFFGKASAFLAVIGAAGLVVRRRP